MPRHTPIDISAYDYGLPDERIAKFPLSARDASKLLVYREGEISERIFSDLGEVLPDGAALVFNNTKVVRARIIMHKESGARIEIFCLEPHAPADYERAFAISGSCVWNCIVGNSKKWKAGQQLHIEFDHAGETVRLSADREEQGRVRFTWNGAMTFGQLLETLGRIPIPPYLGRESEDIDNTRYQTVYSRFEGSVAAPTAGLHFSDSLITSLRGKGIATAEVTLHVGAGTFLPVKDDDASDHTMHAEHFEITLNALEALLARLGKIAVVGTTSVRTLESLAALAWRIRTDGSPDEERTVGQWELYDIPSDFTGCDVLETLIGYMRSKGVSKLKAATQIMIVPGYRFRLTDILITNFHQPRSTLLLLVSAFVGGRWQSIYDYALSHDFRFLSYGDSSILFGARL